MEDDNVKIKKIVKRASALAMTTALLVGGSQAFAAAGLKDLNNDYGFSHITRSDMLKIPGQQNSAQFKAPQFDASTIKNLPSAVKIDQNGNKIALDVWDSWPLQNADGTVANYHGYHIVLPWQATLR
jgi:levansucrase